MIETLGHSIDKLPIRNLKKISDIIEYEGPILSHFVDEKGRNFLFYWVDVDAKYNRWLVWKVSELQLFNYLSGIVSLRDVILEQNKDFIYVIDIDENLNYENIKMLLVEDLNAGYIPEEESFIHSTKLQDYQGLIEKYQHNEYLSFLRKNSIYFTLEPSTPTYSTTVSAIDASNFLKRISNSFLYFIEYDFFNSFKDSISDGSKLLKIIKQFKEILTPRVVDLQFSSFKVALSTDTIQSVEKSIYKPWQSGILDKYKDEVIEVDLSSEAVLRSIVEKYPIEARRNIYTPIIDIINEKNYKLKITDHKRRVVKRFHTITKKQVEILIPRQNPLEEEQENKILLNLIVEVSDKEDIKQMGKRELQDGLLFTQEVKEFKISFESMESTTHKVIFRIPVECDIRLEGNTYYFSIFDFPIMSEAKTMDEGKKSIQNLFIKYYLDVLENPKNYEKTIEDKINYLVDKIMKL